MVRGGNFSLPLPSATGGLLKVCPGSSLKRLRKHRLLEELPKHSLWTRPSNQSPKGCPWNYCQTILWFGVWKIRQTRLFFLSPVLEIMCFFLPHIYTIHKIASLYYFLSGGQALYFPLHRKLLNKVTAWLVVLFLLFLEEEMEAPGNANDFIEVSAAVRLHGWGSNAGVRWTAGPGLFPLQGTSWNEIPALIQETRLGH